MKTLKRIESLQIARNLKNVEYKLGLCEQDELEVAENRLAKHLIG